MTTTIRTSGAFPPTPPPSPIGSPDSFVLTLWTNDPGLARRADDAGVQRIGVDIERLGKAERQRGRGTWISPHTLEDLDALKPVLNRAQLFARVNPLHAGTPDEVAAVLAAGVEVIMLPMVANARDAAIFTGLVDGRARVVLLVECKEAVDRLPDLVAVEGVDEIHLGLNDLALSLGLANRWLVLDSGLVSAAAACVLDAGRRFGLGGIGRVDDETLPIPSDLIYAEYARTGANAALLSRSFTRGPACDLTREVARVHERMTAWRGRDPMALADAHSHLIRRAGALAEW